MKKQKLSNYLIKYIGIFSLVTFISIGVLVVYNTNRALYDIISEKAGDTINLVQADVNHYLMHPIHELEDINKRILTDDSYDDIYWEFQRYDYLSRVEVVSNTGVIVDCYPKYEDRFGLDLGNNDMYKIIRYSENNYELGKMINDSYSGRSTMYISMKSGEEYLIGYLNLLPFQELLAHVNIESGQVAIVDEYGTYISHTEQTYVEQRMVDPYVNKIKNNEIDDGDLVLYFGSDSILHYREIEGTTWRILYYQDSNSINGPIKNLVLSNLVVFLVVLPLFFIVYFRFTRNVTGTMDRLNEITESIEHGEYDLQNENFDFEEFQSLFNKVRAMSHEVNARESKIRRLNEEVESNYYTTIVLLAKAIDAKDNYTGNHSVRVRDLSLLLAEEVDLSERELRELRFGATLHDIGKISIPENVLNKPGKLTDEEYDMIKSHSQTGFDIVAELPGMELAKQVILHHHERYDGKGYPYGLKGDEIPLIARIVTVADSFDAMTSDRPYRKSHMSAKDSFEELRRNAGVQFDPELVELFIEKMKHHTV